MRDKKNCERQEERNNPLLWPSLMMVEACHFPFFPTKQNLICEQLGESEEEARKCWGRDLFLGCIMSLSHKLTAVVVVAVVVDKV